MIQGTASTLSIGGRGVLSPSALLCMAGILSGLIGAVITAPESLDDRTSLQIPAACLMVGFLAGPVVSSVRRTTAILHPTSLMLLGLCYWVLLDLVQAVYPLDDITASGAVGAFFALSLFALGLCVAHFFKPLRLPLFVTNSASLVLNEKRLFKIGIVAFILCFLRFAIPSNFDVFAMFSALSGSRWSAPWSRGQLGGWDAFLDHLSYFGYFLPTLTVAFYRSAGRINYRFWILVLCSVIVALFISQGGGRRTVGAMVLSACFFWIITSEKPFKSLIRFSMTALPILLIFLQAMLFTRNTGYESVFSEFSVNESMKEGVRVDDNFIRLTQIVEIIPKEASHTGFSWVLWVLVRPVPRVFWPGKPMDPGFDLPQHIGREGASLTSSIVGESYMAFGFLGCLIVGICYGMVGRSFKRMLDGNKTFSGLIIYTAGLLALFVGLRSGIELMLFSYVILAWIVASRYMRK